MRKIQFKTEDELERQQQMMDSLSERELHDYMSAANQHTHNLQVLYSEELEPKDVILRILELTCKFYDADWCGILNSNLDIDVLNPMFWYSAETGPMGQIRMREFETSEDFASWVAALKAHNMVYLVDEADIRHRFPKEMERYKQLNVKSMIGVPYYQGIEGYLAVKNPRRFSKIPLLLRQMVFATYGEIVRLQAYNTSNSSAYSECLNNEDDVVITLFNNLQIGNSKGTLKSADIENKVIGQLITILAIAENHTMDKESLAERIRSRENPDGIDPANLKNHIYNFGNQAGNMFGQQKLIVTANGGAIQLNPAYNIHLDLMSFDSLIEEANTTADVNEKIGLLMKAFKMYGHGILPAYRDYDWIYSLISTYSLKYAQISIQLCSLLFEKRDFARVVDISTRCMDVIGDSVDLWYWNLCAAGEIGMKGMAIRQMEVAKSRLSPKEVAELLARIESGE
ncbi:hypothetical protein [Butyrivibrio sp. INlla14]|uniref:hypothetical protein n=1 Tax=Butyrivibrio sp. INlla14 TaxID=1520808 RepID=UPI00087715A9|nr:hypothetical protein [Butyrivibrio sp. INlla14]SCY62793.1 hypothetical protein SAMN02910371_03091 [Butyrivibrio sp. INlla14]